MISSPNSVRSATSHLAVAQVLDDRGTAAGASFLLSGGVVFTCAHVAGEPGTTVRLRFPQVDGAPEAVGVVQADGWSAPDERDVAVVLLEQVPAGVPVLRLGTSVGSRGHKVWSFGFPGQGLEGGQHGYAEAGDPVQDGLFLQLTTANDVTRMYSGAPVVDEVTGLVIGMVSRIIKPDAFQRGQGIALATPAESLRDAWPGLAVKDVCPYHELEPFTAEDAAWFNGRDNAVRKVVAGIRAHPKAVLILGPSGAGKSSLMQAGVGPALKDGAIPGSDEWAVTFARPGQDLVEALDLADGPIAGRRVLVVDQFEQLLTRSGQADRAALTRIAEAIGTPGLTVVMIMRDDFYPVLAADAADLLEAVGPGVVNIPATLSSQDLHDIITRPAAAVRAYLQDGLPERIITDILKEYGREEGRRDEAPATVLPVLEVALAQLWKRRDATGALTHDAYRQIGGISGSLPVWCDKAISALPSDAVHRRTVRRILTALVRPADPDHRIPAVRQQVPLSKLRELAGTEASQVAELVLETLIRHRVIVVRTDTLGEPVAELVHEALIRDWPDLGSWIEQERQFHDWLRRADELREHWETNPHRDNLLHGSDLESGIKYSTERRLPQDTAAFLTAGRANSLRSRRIRRLVLTGMALLTVTATVASIIAVRNASEANRQHVVGLSRQLAAQSQAVASTLPVTARRLAAAAWHTAPTEEAKAVITSLQAQQQSVLVGHDGPVTAVAFSPDGTRLASAGGDGTVRLWETATGKPVGPTFSGHNGKVNAVAFDQEGARLASAGDDGTIQIWDLTTGSQVGSALTGHVGPVLSVAFSPDGTRLASAGTDDLAVRLWDPGTGEQIGPPLAGNASRVFTVAFSPDGTRLVSGGNDSSIRVWDSATGRPIGQPMLGRAGSVRDIAFNANGSRLATANGDGSLQLWDISNRKQVGTIAAQNNDAALSIALSPDGKRVASASNDNTVRIWDAANGRLVGVPLVGHTGPVFSVRFSPDGSVLASGGGDGTIRLWDPVTGRPARAALLGSSRHSTGMAFHPDGTRLLVRVNGSALQLVDAFDGRVASSPMEDDAGQVSIAVFNHDGSRMASADNDATIQLWDPATGEQVGPPLKGHTEFVSELAFSPDGKKLASAGHDGSVRLWDTRAGMQIGPPLGNVGRSNRIKTLAFTSDGTRLAGGDTHNHVWLWDLASGKQIGPPLTGHLNAVLAVRFTTDGSQLLSADEDGAVRTWNPVDGRNIGKPMAGREIGASAMAFTADGTRLAIATGDNEVELWDVATGKPIGEPMTGHTERISHMAFNHDGNWLMTTSDDGTVRIWDTATADVALPQFCARYGPLTDDEWNRYAPGEPQPNTCRP